MGYLKQFYQKLLDAVSANGTTGAVNVLGQAREHAVYVEYGAGVSAGEVTVETASEKAFSGTWDVLTVIAWAAASRSHSYRTTGAYGAIRVRVTSAIVGGTVTVTYVGN